MRGWMRLFCARRHCSRTSVQTVPTGKVPCGQIMPSRYFGWLYLPTAMYSMCIPLLRPTLVATVVPMQCHAGPREVKRRSFGTIGARWSQMYMSRRSRVEKGSHTDGSQASVPKGQDLRGQQDIQNDKTTSVCSADEKGCPQGLPTSESPQFATSSTSLNLPRLAMQCSVDPRTRSWILTTTMHIPSSHTYDPIIT